jgi:Polyketide cyclase / dehydrase and lipid transport
MGERSERPTVSGSQANQQSSTSNAAAKTTPKVEHPRIRHYADLAHDPCTADDRTTPMLETILFVLALAIVAILLLAIRKPDTFRVARTARINAPPDKILPLINDLRAMNTWNTFSLRDPTSKTSYSGPASGIGALHTFDGPKSGGGTIEITGTDAPDHVKMRLQMTRPIKADNTVTFTLTRAGAATDVTWAMEGRSPFMIKVMTLFFNHDAMMHSAFDEGLANLKALAEKT